jgi:polyisoprenoid-binding protein YceI
MAAMRTITLLVTAAAVALLPTGAFVLDPASSQVEFLMRDNRGGFSGVARDIDTTVTVREQGEGFVADVEARIDARTITTGIGLRDSQMRRDFLLADRFPLMTFRGTVVPLERPGALSFRAVMRGALTIKDATREIEVPLRVTALRDTYLAEGQVTIRLSDFQIAIPRFLIFVAEDPVQITLKVRLTEK